MPKFMDLSGQRYGNLTVISRSENKGKAIYWNCICDCGNKCIIRGSHMREGRTFSCQKCGRQRQSMATSKKYERNGNLYHVWVAMKQRCFNPRSQEYYNYGGRGITVCDEWFDYVNFYEWARGKYEPGLTIDRIDVNGNYEPSNCRFVPQSIQNVNRRNNRYVTYNGETKAASEMAKKYGFRPSVLYKRLKTGWTIERALTEPLHTEMIHR